MFSKKTKKKNKNQNTTSSGRQNKLGAEVKGYRGGGWEMVTEHLPFPVNSAIHARVSDCTGQVRHKLLPRAPSPERVMMENSIWSGNKQQIITHNCF